MCDRIYMVRVGIYQEILQKTKVRGKYYNIKQFSWGEFVLG